MPPWADLLDDVEAAARAAGARIMAVYRGGFRTQVKADGSPVTEADMAADRAIAAALAGLTPDIPVVSEENGAAARPPPGRLFWLVDPLDGTDHFIRRDGEFCVCIGLIADGQPVLGVIHGPAQDITYGGAGPRTARRYHGDSAPEPIRCRRPNPEGVDVMGGKPPGSVRTARLPDGQGAERDVTVRRLCRMGSALKFGLVAAGAFDFYIRRRPTGEWDTAAGHALLRSAGGDIIQLDGRPLTYGKPGFHNPHFLAHGRPF